MKVAHTVYLTLLLLSLTLFSSAGAGEIRYARYPALSPDGNTIAFTYRGDIWVVGATGGEARRLTVHEAEDIRPQFSPDGRWIAFSSRRFNNYDVYVIAASGGAPQRITHHSAADYACGWTPAGDSVLFSSTRAGWRDLYIAAVTGGTPLLLTGYAYEQEYNGRLSADGRYLYYNNGSGLSRWWRRDLKASRNCDIFVTDRTQQPFTSRRLTTHGGHDIWPVVNEQRDEVYFVSCRGDWGQVWRTPLAGGEATPLTDFTGDGVQWLNGNPQGTLLVFEQNFGIWLLDPADGEPRPVPITVQSDERDNLETIETFKGDVSWFSLSPDEKKIAAVVRGEIYVIPAEEPETGFRLTHTQGREKYPVWGSDSKTLYYSSDRNGNDDIYSVDVTSGTETRLTATPENEVKPIVSPDGAFLAYYRGLDRIIRRDLDSGEETDWVSGTFFDLGIETTIEYDWSPDSKWLTFTMAGPTYETHIFAVPLDGSPREISKLAGYTYSPRFSHDGKLIYLSSYAEGESRTYKVELTHKPFEFYEAAFDSLFFEDEADDKKDEEAKKDVAATVDTVHIDFDRIEKRRFPAYSLAASSNTAVLTPDGKKWLFVASLMGKPEIWSVNAEGDQELTQITTSGGNKEYLVVSDDSKQVYFLEGGVIRKVEIDNQKSTKLSFTAALDIDARELNRQKFIESWQTLNTYFYDGDFHGTDWQQIREKYEPVVAEIRSPSEFGNLIKEMMGELRASHLSIYPSQPQPDEAVVTAETGIRLDYGALARDRRFRIGRVISESPADLAGISSGQYLRAVNGTALTGDENVFSLLAGQTGKRLTLGVSDRPGGAPREVDIKPISRSDLNRLVHAEWVERRREIVDSLSAGRLAYIHIPAMSGTELARFKENLVAIAEAKEGLIIDVRNNGGGNIAVHLLGILAKTPWFLRNFRDFPTTTENKMRSKAFEKPMTLLINNYSASNSEIFAEGFRRLKLGTIVGEPTAGAVIGTASYRLIDGTRIRRPSWGAFTMDMEDTDLVPRQPDILVENLPDDFINGRDPQLVRAIQELMKELP